MSTVGLPVYLLLYGDLFGFDFHMVWEVPEVCVDGKSVKSYLWRRFDAKRIEVVCVELVQAVCEGRERWNSLYCFVKTLHCLCVAEDDGILNRVDVGFCWFREVISADSDRVDACADDWVVCRIGLVRIGDAVFVDIVGAAGLSVVVVIARDKGCSK